MCSSENVTVHKIVEVQSNSKFFITVKFASISNFSITDCTKQTTNILKQTQCTWSQRLAMSIKTNVLAKVVLLNMYKRLDNTEMLRR